MAKAKADTYKDWVRAVVPRLRGHFYLEAWYVDLVWEIDENSPETVAHIEVNSEYLQAVLHMYPLAKELFDKGKVERLALYLTHEFAHILTEPLYELAANGVTLSSLKSLQTIREQQTQRIALAVFRGIPEELYSL